MARLPYLRARHPQHSTPPEVMANAECCDRRQVQLRDLSDSCHDRGRLTAVDTLALLPGVRRADGRWHRTRLLLRVSRDRGAPDPGGVEHRRATDPTIGVARIGADASVTRGHGVQA